MFRLGESYTEGLKHPVERVREISSTNELGELYALLGEAFMDRTI